MHSILDGVEELDGSLEKINLVKRRHHVGGDLMET